MLKLIAKFVGKPKDLSELSFVTNPKAQKFMEDLPDYPPADLRRRFPSAGSEAVDLLARMLVMRPDRRLSVDEALRHPYLKSLRDKKVTNVRCGVPWLLVHRGAELSASPSVGVLCGGFVAARTHHLSWCRDGPVDIIKSCLLVRRVDDAESYRWTKPRG